MESIQSREFRNRIGSAIKRLRTEEHLNAAFLAKVLGVSQPTISRIEAGVSSIPAEKLCLLATTFNRPLSYFVGEQSRLVINEKDLIRAGLVRYGARHLRSKAGINLDEHYRNYADLLNSALTEAGDSRIAHAIAATLYQQAVQNKLNSTSVITTVTHRKLLANLWVILEATIAACHSIEYQKPRVQKSSAEDRLKELRQEIEKEGNIILGETNLPEVDPKSIAIFINQGQQNE